MIGKCKQCYYWDKEGYEKQYESMKEQIGMKDAKKCPENTGICRRFPPLQGICSTKADDVCGEFHETN